MKKAILSILGLGLMLASCDMNKEPEGSISDSGAISSYTTAFQFRNYLNSILRSRSGGSWTTITDIMADNFIGLTINGNRGGNLANGGYNSSYSDFESYYASIYAGIANVNYFLDNIDAVAESEALTDDQKAEVKRYIGEAKFIRAYSYWWLFDHYCQAYSADKADQEGLGLSLVTTYEPTGDTSKYPGRSTMNEALSLINTDLDEAYDALKDYEQNVSSTYTTANACYLSSYAVAALQARVALATGDNQTALDKAQIVIGNSNYQLAEGEDYVNMWTTDEGSELIYVPYVDADESGSIASACETFNYWWSDSKSCDYIPTYETLCLYDDEDIRFEAFYGVHTITIDGANTRCYAFYKFPGNDNLIVSTNYYKNKPKPFRLSEQYLIVAEAAYNLGQASVANDALNTLLAARIEGYEGETLSGSALRDKVREEREKELIGEGFRFSDLRRWDLGFSRDSSYPINSTIAQNFVTANKNVVFTAGDYRYTWPIPDDEIFINPQLAGQQNPGY